MVCGVEKSIFFVFVLHNQRRDILMFYPSLTKLQTYRKGQDVK